MQQASNCPKCPADDPRCMLRSERGMIHPPRGFFVFGGVGIARAAEIVLEFVRAFTQVVPPAQEFAPFGAAERCGERFRKPSHFGSVRLQASPSRSRADWESVCA